MLLHIGEPLTPHDLASAWVPEPSAAIPLVLLGAAYALGVARLWRSAGPGRGVSMRHAATFAAGWLALGIAVASPLHALGGALFSAHMVQHTILIAVAPPLLLLGRPAVALAWALPSMMHRAAASINRAVQRPPWRAVRTLAYDPWATTAVASIALWVWHAPALYALVLHSEVAHAAQHVTFLATATAQWHAVLGTHTRRRPLVGALALFVAALQSGALGALIALAPRLLVTAYATTTAPWGLTPLEDQQLAGLVMWIPGGLTYLVAALVLFGRALRR